LVVMLRLVVVCVLSCAVESRLRQPAGSDVADKLEVVERKSTPVFKNVVQEMQLVAKELESGMNSKNKTAGAEALKKATSSVAEVKKEFEAVKKEFDAAIKSGKKMNDTKFPWWANASAGSVANFSQTKAPKDAKVAKNDTEFPWWANASSGNMPNLTQTKTEKAPKDAKVAKNDTKFPWWANASAGNVPNFSQTKTEKAPKDAKVAKNDTEFPWWANASAGNVPNFSQTKTEKVAKNDTKFPWWANASAGNVPNFTQITKDLPKELPKGQPTFADLGPFASKVAACDYCFTSNTRTSVVPNCICTAYQASDGPTMFCTASAAGVKWVAAKDGGCKCVENNQAAMGETTCDPF